MFGLEISDLAVIVGYSLLIILIGLVAMLRVKNQEDFFLGGRRFGKFLQVFAVFGQATSTENVVGTVTTTYRDGAGGIWSSLLMLWMTPFYWFTAPWYRRMRVLTMGDFFQERYASRTMGMFYSLVSCFLLIVMICIGLKAMSVTALAITLKPEAEMTAAEKAERASSQRLEFLDQKSAAGQLSAGEARERQEIRDRNPRREFSHLSEAWLVWSIVAVVFLYGILGGLEASVWIDTVQGTLIIVLSFLLIPFAMAKINALHGASGFLGAFEVMHQELPGYFFSALGSAQNADFTWYFIIVMSLLATINVAAQANQFTSNAAARDEWTARVGFVTGSYLKRFCTVMWGLAGLMAFVLYSREIKNSDYVWGHATRDLLGGLNLGLVGLMIACLLAALQSTASALMISASSLFTKNVYEVLWPGRGERHYVFVGRVTGTVVLVAAALLCTAFESILEMLKFLWEFNVIVAASFWCGIKWRGATRAGAWSSIGVSFLLFSILPFALPLVFPGMKTDPRLQRAVEERVITEVYPASARDAQHRAEEIAGWKGEGNPPPALREGDPVTRSALIPPKPIYWSRVAEQNDGILAAQGLFYPEMYLFDRIFDLSKNPYALNETIRYANKIILPFLVLIAVSLLTRRDPGISEFFLRMRTPVRRDREEDERAVREAYAQPEQTASRLLFPERWQLEFFKWNKQDTLGFLISLLAVFAVIGFLYGILALGA